MPPARKRRTTLEVLRELRRPKVAIMLGLGFSSGLPFLLVGNTLNYWLGDAHVDLAVIGFASWIGLTYSLKFLWGAVVDNLTLPGLGRLGRRRGWMLGSQILVLLGLAGMAASDPRHGLATLVGFGVLAALGAATQDTVIDAWRIETAEDAADLELLTSAYSLGYRVVLILTGSVVLFIAAGLGWPLSYAMFAALMVVGLGCTLAAREPARAEQASKARALTGFSPMRVVDAVVGPFVAFFRTLGPIALLILLAVTTYHLCDYLRGPVINPFYVQVGLAKPLVASVRLTVGIATSMLGIAAAGLFGARFGHMPTLILGAILQPIAVASFAILAWTGPDPRVFSVIMGLDDFCMSFAGLALVAYISTLTNLGYTATQYALLTSALAWTGKFLKGFSGEWVKGLARGGRDLTHAYATYFGIAAAAAGAPALLLILALAWAERRRQASGLPLSARTS